MVVEAAKAAAKDLGGVEGALKDLDGQGLGIVE